MSLTRTPRAALVLLPALLVLPAGCNPAPRPVAPPPPPTAASRNATAVPYAGDVGPMYFSRTAQFERNGDRIVALEPRSARPVPLEPMPELVFWMADGQRTVNQLRADLASQYKNGPPPDLAEQVRSIVRDLERQHLLRFHKDPTPLPSYLAKPVSDQDPEEAKRAMEQDGFAGGATR
jgi:hypothetical protein